MDKDLQQTAIALATAVLNNDTRSFVQITSPMDREQMQDTFAAVSLLFTTVMDDGSRAQVLENLQNLALRIANKDEA